MSKDEAFPPHSGAASRDVAKEDAEALLDADGRRRGSGAKQLRVDRVFVHDQTGPDYVFPLDADVPA